MRVECESCRELVTASFGITGGEVRATCAACHHVMLAPMAAANAEKRRSKAPSEISLSLCPKCGAPRSFGDACASCGLAVARMPEFTQARDAAVPEVVREAWNRVIDSWNVATAHDELLRLVAVHDCYAWAAGRYRARRDDIAQRQLERVRRAAEATMLASATVRADASTAPYRATRGVLIFMVIALIIGLAYAMVVRARAPVPPAPAQPVRPLEAGHPVSPSTIK